MHERERVGRRLALSDQWRSTVSSAAHQIEQRGLPLDSVDGPAIRVGAEGDGEANPIAAHLSFRVLKGNSFKGRCEGHSKAEYSSGLI